MAGVDHSLHVCIPTFDDDEKHKQHENVLTCSKRSCLATTPYCIAHVHRGRIAVVHEVHNMFGCIKHALHTDALNAWVVWEQSCMQLVVTSCNCSADAASIGSQGSADFLLQPLEWWGLV